jgi:hypothetical protein
VSPIVVLSWHVPTDPPAISCQQARHARKQAHLRCHPPAPSMPCATSSFLTLSTGSRSCLMWLISSRVRYVLPGSDIEWPWYLAAVEVAAAGLGQLWLAVEGGSWQHALQD